MVEPYEWKMSHFCIDWFWVIQDLYCSTTEIIVFVQHIQDGDKYKLYSTPWYTNPFSNFVMQRVRKPDVSVFQHFVHVKYDSNLFVRNVTIGYIGGNRSEWCTWLLVDTH